MLPILSIENLAVGYAAGTGSVEAVRDVSLGLAPGECLGLVGESGAGKTQVFMAVMGLTAANARVRGSVRFDGDEILGLPPPALNRMRGSSLTMIFQDPMSSLTPHLKIGEQLAEVLVSHRGATWREARGRALEILERVRVPEPRRRMTQYPHELSGGMRQRVMIGMSLLCGPQLLIADEPTSALDVTVQAAIIDLLRELRTQSGMAIALISHDLGVVAGIADRILVMYAGRVVENGRAQDLLRQARHPYTALLLACAPRLADPPRDRMPCVPGQPPSASEVHAGCAFAPRCPRATERCRAERPPLVDAAESAQVACHHPMIS